MNNNELLGALSMDLKRIALCFHRNSYRTAGVFIGEAQKRIGEIRRNDLMPYMQTILHDVQTLLSENPGRRPDDVLMYSTRIQNYVLSR